MAEKKLKENKKIVEEKQKKVKPEKVKKEKIQNVVEEKQIQKEPKKVKHTKKQLALQEKKAKLAVKGRQTKWAPVWVVIKKYGTGKKIHPSTTTAVKRNWRRTKLHIKPRKIRKSHLG